MLNWLENIAQRFIEWRWRKQAGKAMERRQRLNGGA
jgi:hypothetical protein